LGGASSTAHDDERDHDHVDERDDELVDEDRPGLCQRALS
jgi:hypothetical protein